MNRNDAELDALVIGAGVAGCASAYQLSSEGWQVAVLYSGRDTTRGTESISPEASRRLGQLSVRVGTPFSQVVAWWGSANPVHTHCPDARIVQREELSREMRAMVARRGVPLAEVRSLIGLARVDGIWHIRCEGLSVEKRTVKARYLVDATGRACAVGRLLGARRKSPDQLCCISIPADAPGAIGTWTEAVSGGWWNLCSDGKRGTLSFYCTPSLLGRVKHDLAGCLTQSREIKRLVALPVSNWHKVRPCGSSRLDPCAGIGWLAVGDAAMTIQPLTSAGVATALRDAQTIVLALASNPREYDGFHNLGFQKYLRELAEQYALEGRFPKSTFWQNVPAAATAASAIQFAS